MEARASAKYLRGSAQKARLVIDMIRGKDVNEALAVLQFTHKRAADGIEKCVRSAIANATERAEKANIAIDLDDLWVKACFVDMGPTKNRRRFRPAPQGRAYRERRHFCHVTVLLSSDERETAGNGKAGASKAGKPQTGGASSKHTTKRASASGGASAVAPKRASKKGEGGETTATKRAKAAAPVAEAEQTAPVESATNETSAE
jgi:large subunit ribosomal protein L22